MKILHVIATLSARSGGPSAAVIGLCRALADRGHELDVYTTNLDGRGSSAVELGTRTLVGGVPVTHFAGHWPRSFSTSFGLGLALHRTIRTFDIVHVHSLYQFHTLVAGVLCRRHRIPYLVRPHGTLDPYHRARHPGRKALYDILFERRHLNSAAGIHVTSEAERDAVEGLGLRAPCFVVPHGVEPVDPPSPRATAELLERHLELSGRTLVTFLGRLTPKKGLDILIEAFATVAATDTRAHLVVAGPDDEGLGARARTQSAALGVADRVSFLGLVTGGAKGALLQQSSVFVLPSADENFGVSVFEAMAASLPVVVTPGVATHAQIAAAGAGTVVARNPDAIADAIAALLADRPRALQVGENGRRLVAEAYSWPTAAERLEEIYVGAVGRGRGAPRRAHRAMPGTLTKP
jgi:glycosyltransferase involved in cell wall biosynthesis